MKYTICALALAAFGIAGNVSAETSNSELDPKDPAQQTRLITKVVTKELAHLEQKRPGLTSKFIDALDCETHNSRDGLITHLHPDGTLVKNVGDDGTVESGSGAAGYGQFMPEHFGRDHRWGVNLVDYRDQAKYAAILIEYRIEKGQNALQDWYPCLS